MIGSRLELFVDEWLVDTKQGISLTLHPPVPREVVLRFNEPWENGTNTAYTSLLKMPLGYYLYYDCEPKEPPYLTATCVAYSKDGITWTKPSLGSSFLTPWPQSNVLRKDLGGIAFYAFVDANPSAPSSEMYKALGGAGRVVTFTSADGIQWRGQGAVRMRTPISFDSMNTAFWDVVHREYVAYFRDSWHRRRGIRVSTSPDFRTWSEPLWLEYDADPKDQLYTNSVAPYFRASHIFLGFPMRFVPDRTVVREQPKSGISDVLFMSSRDGLRWTRFADPFVRPGLDRLNWMHRSLIVTNGMVQTSPKEISIYFIEHYNTDENQLRRATLRTDGFASLHAGRAGGEFVTKPLIFDGHQLLLNERTSAVGSIRVEIQDALGNAMRGFSMEESDEIYGDELRQVVSWRGMTDVSQFAGKRIRLRFFMSDADLFALTFADPPAGDSTR